MYEPGDIIRLFVHPAAGARGERWCKFIQRDTLIAQTSKLSKYAKHDIYVGVCPRPNRERRQSEISIVRSLWCEIDDCSYEEALQRIEASGLPAPSIAIRSRRGGHFYWLLSGPFLITDCSQHGGCSSQPTKQGRVIWLLNQAIAECLGGDHVQDLARPLRLPGAIHPKSGEPTVLEQCDPSRRVTVNQMQDLLADYVDEKSAPIDLKTTQELLARGAPSSGGSAPTRIMTAPGDHGRG